ncbi:MAG TPA: DUF2207 domain-containing protein [Candidatus Acidoferrales bacterium]|nr:DUF2207 domain-containing protein [Candidatus Acidoferrales bacterium]
MRKLHRAIIFLVAVLAAAWPATARQLTIHSFDVQIDIHPDSTIEVTEILEVKFDGSWNGIYRTIPVEYRTAEGFNYTLFLEPEGVTDDNGNPLKYEVSQQHGYKRLKIYVPNAVNATRTVVIRYRALNALRYFADHDELYWNITGNEWEAPIENATARIELPGGVTGLHATSFSGGFGSRGQDAEVKVEGNVVQVRMQRPLFYHEGLTAVVGWDTGFTHEPGAFAKAILFMRSNWPFFIPIGVFFLMGWLWYTRGRDPRRNPITVQYEPPEGMTPGEVGTLVDNEAAMRDITATIVDLAVRGLLTIEQKDKDQLLGILHHKEYVFHRTKAATEWLNLKPHEQLLLGALFDGGVGDSVSLSQLQNHFYVHLPAIRNRIFDGLMSDGFYLHRPDKLKQGFIGAGVVIGFLSVWAAGLLSAATGVSSLTTILSGIFTGAIIAGFGFFMSARTVSGERALERVLGFEDFLGRVEKDQIERLEKTPAMFEKFLPYAMALRVEKKWVSAFQGIYTQPPQWYSGPYGAGFQPYLLVTDLDFMSAQAGTAMASSPRSAGGSGFGGGGFSGGGFGGGGGGGF